MSQQINEKLMSSLWNLFDNMLSWGSTTVWSIVIIVGEIFTIEPQPGSERRVGIDSGQTECETNWQLYIACKGEANSNHWNNRQAVQPKYNV